MNEIKISVIALKFTPFEEIGKNNIKSLKDVSSEEGKQTHKMDFEINSKYVRVMTSKFP